MKECKQLLDKCTSSQSKCRQEKCSKILELSCRKWKNDSGRHDKTIGSKRAAQSLQHEENKLKFDSEANSSFDLQLIIRRRQNSSLIRVRRVLGGHERKNWEARKEKIGSDCKILDKESVRYQSKNCNESNRHGWQN